MEMINNQEAKSLVGKFHTSITAMYEDVLDYNTVRRKAKQCAVNCIGMMIEENQSVFEMLRLHGTERSIVPVMHRISELQTMKKEIEQSKI